MENNAAKNGLMAGLVIAVISLVAFFIEQRLFFGTAVTLLSIAAYAFFMVSSAKTERENNEGFLSWQQALKPTFLTLVIGAIFVTLFCYAMFEFIDPSLYVTEKDVAIEGVEMANEALGIEMDDEMLEAIEDKDMTFGASRILQELATRFIFGFILAAIISAIVKKDPPEMV